MKYRNANIWIMSILFMSGVFCTANCFASVLPCLNMCLKLLCLKNETDFEFVFAHFLLKKKIEKLKMLKKKCNFFFFFFFFFLIWKETNAYTPTNGSFETNLFFNMA